MTSILHKVHRPEITKRSKGNYAKQKSKIISRVKAWKEKNRNRVNATRRARYAADHQRCLERGRLYASRRKASGKAAEYRSKTRARWRAWSRARSARADDDYARELLSKYSPISAQDWPQELVEAKKLEIKLRRTLKSA